MEDSFERFLVRKAAKAQTPVNASLELTPLCNMNCRMCYVRLSRAEMASKGCQHPGAQWLELGKQMAEAGVLFVLLTGGEPLLHPHFREIYLGLKQLGMVLTVNTNGTLIDEDWADFFGANKPRRVNITLYGSGRDTYGRLCGFPEGYDRTVRAIRLLRQRGVAVKINGSAVKSNVADMEAIYRLGRELGCPVHIDTDMLPGLHERELPLEAQSRLSPEAAARAEMQTLRQEMTPEAFREYVFQTANTLRAGTEPAVYPAQISCLAGNCSFAVNWQGQMRPCVSLEEPSVPVFETGFDRAWEAISRESKALRLNSRCTACPLRPVCRICTASARLETGRYEGIPSYHCRYAAAFRDLLLQEQEALERA